MEHDFFEMYENQGCLSLELGHNSVADWVLVIRDKKDTRIGEQGKQIFQVQSCDRKKVFAEAYHLLTEYLSEERGGY
ncbi:hypothetical protein [uncultured Amphritea sp.]|uniref:hypothetical protein n=1 Tax=uncultured Amphritea sp. TaxID=981605 RepID=UPI00260DB926|nr:hypothetical protein [uncultured Amphritea sp.]